VTSSGTHLKCIQPEIKVTTVHNQDPIPLKKVRWGNIEMRLHSVIPGDHPDTREGPPVSGTTTAA
jgi:hypothetical protein